MELKVDSNIPIYVQIAEAIEDMILDDQLSVDEQAPSTTQLSAHFNLNPATALKGLNLLVEGQILHKKRGLGMYVNQDAKAIIQKKRQQRFIETYIVTLIKESKRLGIAYEDIIAMIQEEGSKLV